VKLMPRRMAGCQLWHEFADILMLPYLSGLFLIWSVSFKVCCGFNNYALCVVKYSGCCGCGVEEHPYYLGRFLGWFGCSLIFFSSCVISTVAVSLMEIDGGAR
jgi:hypothetical protein